MKKDIKDRIRDNSQEMRSPAGFDFDAAVDRAVAAELNPPKTSNKQPGTEASAGSDLKLEQ